MKRLIGYVVCFVDEHDEIEGLASASIGGYHEACASLRREREIYKHTKARLRIVRLDGSVHRPGSKLPADRQSDGTGGGT